MLRDVLDALEGATNSVDRADERFEAATTALALALGALADARVDPAVIAQLAHAGGIALSDLAGAGRDAVGDVRAELTAQAQAVTAALEGTTAPPPPAAAAPPLAPGSGSFPAAPQGVNLLAPPPDAERTPAVDWFEAQVARAPAVVWDRVRERLTGGVWLGHQAVPWQDNLLDLIPLHGTQFIHCAGVFWSDPPDDGGPRMAVTVPGQWEVPHPANPTSSINVVLHEVGHAWDFALGLTAPDAGGARHPLAGEFEALYDACAPYVDRLAEDDGYYASSSAAGRAEFFAETFAATFAANGDPNRIIGVGAEDAAAQRLPSEVKSFHRRLAAHEQAAAQRRASAQHALATLFDDPAPGRTT